MNIDHEIIVFKTILISRMNIHQITFKTILKQFLEYLLNKSNCDIIL